MRNFSASEMRTFNDGVCEISLAGNVEGLSRATLGALSRLIPCDKLVFGERVAGGPFRSDAFIYPDGREFRKHQLAYMGHLREHPIDRHFAATRNESAVTIEDTIEPHRWRRSGLYNEFFRPLRLDSLLACVFATDTMPYVGIGLTRSGRDFDASDRFMLDLIRRHIKRAYERISRSTTPVTTVVLTPREHEVLTWAAAGKTNGQIGIILEISARTTQKHLEHIFQKLGVETRTSAVVRAMELKLISATPDDC